MYDITDPTNSGRVIAVWSPVSRQGAVSTTSALLASYLSLTEGEPKVLLFSNDSSGGATSNYYITKERMINGLAEVIELSISDNLKNPEDIYKNAFSLSSTLDALNCAKSNTNVTDFLPREVPNILKVARSGYKYIIVDCVYGQYDDSTMRILNNSDIIVVCMPQDNYIFEGWVRKLPDIFPDVMAEKLLVLVSSMHYEYADMTYESMRKRLRGRGRHNSRKKKAELYYISLNDVIHKAVTDRDIITMVTREFKKSKGQDDVISELTLIVDKISQYLDLVVANEIEKEKELVKDIRKRTDAYLENNSDYFNDMGYGSGNKITSVDGKVDSPNDYDNDNGYDNDMMGELSDNSLNGGDEYNNLGIETTDDYPNVGMIEERSSSSLSEGENSDNDSKDEDTGSDMDLSDFDSVYSAELDNAIANIPEEESKSDEQDLELSSMPQIGQVGQSEQIEQFEQVNQLGQDEQDGGIYLSEDGRYITLDGRLYVTEDGQYITSEIQIFASEDGGYLTEDGRRIFVEGSDSIGQAEQVENQPIDTTLSDIYTY